MPRPPFAMWALIVVLAAGLLLAGCGDDDDDDAGGGGDTTEESGIEGVETFEVDGRDHVEGTVDYDQTPPVGGDHFKAWRNCGFYDEPVPNEQAVHSMEHGAVWVTFRPGLSADQVEILRGIAESQDFVLISPYPDLPSSVVASAWGVQLKLESADDPRLEQFLAEYRQGPQTPEPGAPCTGGTSG